MIVINEFVIKDFWWSNLGKLSPQRSVHRGGRGVRGARRNQPEEQPAVKRVDPTTPATHANLAAMEQRYKDLLFEVLAQRQLVRQSQSAHV